MVFAARVTNTKHHLVDWIGWFYLLPVFRDFLKDNPNTGIVRIRRPLEVVKNGRSARRSANFVASVVLHLNPFLKTVRSWRKDRTELYVFLISTLAVIGDIWCLIRYRKWGLFKYKRIYVAPEEVKLGFKSDWPKFHIGVVSSKWEKLELVPVEEAAGGTVRRCLRRMEPGQTWDSVGELSAQLKQKTTTEQIEKVHSTFASQLVTLDALIESVRSSGTLLERNKFPPPFFREWRGVSVIVSSSGDLILHDGHHRFGITLALKIKRIPVALVSVHPRFAKSKEWRNFLTKHV